MSTAASENGNEGMNPKVSLDGPVADADKEATEGIGANAGNSGAQGTERDALIAAVKAASAKSEDDGKGKREADWKPQKPQAKDEAANDNAATAKPEANDNAEEDEKNLPKLARILKQREKAQGHLVAAQEAEAKAKAAYAEAEQIVQQSKRYAAQLAHVAQKLRTDPVSVINELGIDPEQIIEAATKKNDPQWQAKRQYEDRFTQLEKQLANERAAREKLEAIAQSYEEQGATHAKASAEQKLLGLIPEDSPARKIWDERYILQMAYDVDAQVKSKRGDPPSLKDLCDYIHYEAVRRTGGLKPQESAGNGAKKSKANGSRALTSRDASERRGAGSSKSYDEMTPDEQRAHLIAVAKEANRVG